MAEVELQQIGAYTITGLLHESSTSNFYLGKNRKKNVLIQRINIPFANAEDKKAFLARTKQLKKLKDRTIVPILEANFDGDTAYLVIEQPTGKPLQQIVTPGVCLSSDVVRRYISPIASALHYAHMNHVIHGNLHPGAILQTERLEMLLTGFALTPPGFTPSLDNEAAAIPYMAPEHLQGQPTTASDQYALAVMTYEWLCGRRPYEATEREQLLAQQQQADFPKPSSLNKNISALVEQVLLQALALDPEQRFPHTQALANAYLSALMGLPVKTPEIRSSARPTVPTTPTLRRSEPLHQCQRQYLLSLHAP
ncbi:hypothetical protein KDW_11370 [Dictyobacter vulcani]|uniref:Protein kinase domain-containing protein n=1 Tax=Dictyobacter vulcani TaxID=2607529 RepID=A0A5J4KH92_9CHLR|nr:serine/threonine-protein kinase [Dictyobacter vulcani]GER86975.1 hypothetical protein KDW_11370 [Dictyobacter vulcani]